MSGFLVLILFSGIGKYGCLCMAQDADALSVASSVRLEPTDSVSPVVKKHSPKKASIYSAVLPGLGQIYNRKYWKVPIVYAGFGTLAYFVVYNGNRLKKYTQAYLDFTDTLTVTDSYLDLIGPNLDPATFDPILHPGSYNPSLAESFENLLKNNRDYFRRYRDLSYIGLAAWYVLNIIDASVDAHMYDFDVGEDLVLRVEPAWQPTRYGMNMTGVRCTLTF